jgi:hypothetical protein
MFRIKEFFNYYPISILLISLLFLIKTLYLSFFITPFSGIPDEIGHFAYVQDIANGKGIPVLSISSDNKSVIGADIMGYIENTTNARPAYNWIAQHPPIYYFIAAIPLKIGNWLTNDINILYRLPRIVSSLSGALLLLVLFSTFRTAGLDSSRATTIAAAVGFIPMISHLSSGTNHDISLFLFCALATYFFTRYIIHRQIRDCYWSAVWLAVAAGTKIMTPWALLAPMIFIFTLEISEPKRFKHILKLSLISTSTIMAWMVRNTIYFGNPLYTSGTDRKPGLDVPLQQNFLDFIQTQSVFDRTIQWFYGMFGHLGPGSEDFFLEYDKFPRHIKFSIIAANGFSYSSFLLLLSITACICTIYISILLWNIYHEKSKQFKNNSLISWINACLNKDYYKFPLLAIFFLTAIFFAAFLMLTGATSLNFISFLPVSISIFLGISAIPMIFYTTDNVDRIALYGFIITLFFGSIFLYHIYSGFLIDGSVPALQGRYFYPIIPLATLSVSIALSRLKVSRILINSAVVFLACSELYVFINQVIPFYLKYYP